MKKPSTLHRSAGAVLVGVLTIGLGGTAGARIDRDIPTGTTRQASVLNSNTDIATLIAAPFEVLRGSNFRATISVSNVGRLAARNITCGVSTPPANTVATFALGISARRIYDNVEGNQSREFRVPVLAAGETRAIRLTAETVGNSSQRSFTISAYCTPTPVDSRQSNNASSVTVYLA